MPSAQPLVRACPAKLNLMLAITGVRADGFHELVSLVTPLKLEDTLTVEPLEPGATEDTLTCDAPDVPTGPENLVRQATAAFRQATGSGQFYRFALAKTIPAGAGLGGGSSNGAATLTALNELAGKPLKNTALEELAAQLGSDCPLFLRPRPLIMRGRGELLEELPEDAARALRGRPVVVFKPAFGVSTGWAYGQLRNRAPVGYEAADAAEARLQAWLANPQSPLPLFNSLEAPVFAKYLALPTLLEQIRECQLGPAMMTGSGSACFALPESDASAAEIVDRVAKAWGGEAFVVRTAFA